MRSARVCSTGTRYLRLQQEFHLSPYTWLKTYTYALESYWFNPYLPFGGSSCTFIAQRQSDTIRTVARVAGMKALTVAMLDDFLLVCPRQPKDSDQDALNRGRPEGEFFDKVLRELILPKAVSKGQPTAFTTNWCGVQFFSKEAIFGIPKKKWDKFTKFFRESILNLKGGLAESFTADLLRTALGKFCHFMRIWPAGRPCLYPL